MFARWADNGNPTSLASRLRQRRVRRFVNLLELRKQANVIDIGGSESFWLQHRHELPADISITIVNTYPYDPPCEPWLKFVQADARSLKMFANNQFDVCFSNSVIEHAGTADDQRAMADEIRRVASGYFVQTPNFYFPIEPHFLVPGWQFLPVSARAQLLRLRDWGWMKRTADPSEARQAVESIQLLTTSGMKRLFPDARIFREHLGPLTKSLVAWRPV